MMMNHQLNLPWELSTMTLCLGLPQVAQLPHQWVVISADGQSVGSTGSKLSRDLNLDLGSCLVEDLFYQQAPSITIAPKSSISLSEPVVNEPFTFIDDFNLLPSSPESVDFDDLSGIDPELFAFNISDLDGMEAYRSQSDIFNKSLSPDNTHVELAVQDPEIAMNLLQQLGSQEVDSANLDGIQSMYSYISKSPAVEASLVSPEPLIPHQAHQLASMDLLAEPAFQVDTFFATPHSSKIFLEVSDSSEAASETLEIKRSCSSDELASLTSSSSHTSLVTAAYTSGCFFSPELLQRLSTASPGSLSDNSSITSDVSSDVTNTNRRSLIARPEKRLRKKEQNKTAALKYRQKKRTEQGNFVNECLEIERKNAELKQRVGEITREINYLKGLLKEIAV